jgi:UDP-glucuronate 4-epimerase
VTVLHFIGVLAGLLGKEPQLNFLPMQPGDVSVTCADVSKLRERVGFEPSTTLADGLSRFVDWFRHWNAAP